VKSQGNINAPISSSSSSSSPWKEKRTICVDIDTVWYCVYNCVLLNFKILFFVKIKCGLYFLDRFDVLMSKMIFKK